MRQISETLPPEEAPERDDEMASGDFDHEEKGHAAS